jgi:hypothetical protein
MEHGIDIATDTIRVTPPVGTGHKVLAHRKRREDQSVLRHQRHPSRDNFSWCLANEFFTFKFY